MTHKEMLQLVADAQNWDDAADWKDNCGRLSRLLSEIPSMIEKIETFEEEVEHLHLIPQLRKKEHE